MGHTRAKRRAAYRASLGEHHVDEDILTLAGRLYDPEIHDEDSVYFRDTYTGPSERELMGGCNRCGGWDDCYCPDPPTRAELRMYNQARKCDGPTWDVYWAWDGAPITSVVFDTSTREMTKLMRAVREQKHHQVQVRLVKNVPNQASRTYNILHGSVSS